MGEVLKATLQHYNEQKIQVALSVTITTNSVQANIVEWTINVKFRVLGVVMSHFI